MSQDIGPGLLMDEAKRRFPKANHIDLKCRTEASYNWMKLDKTGDEYDTSGYETRCTLSAQEGPVVVMYLVGESTGVLWNQLQKAAEAVVI